MYTVIIIDDELRARTLSKGLIETYCPGFEVIDLCADLPTGVKSIRKHQPDLVLLDIEMPNYSGLELLDFFNQDEVRFSVIFVTAYSEYAIQALRMAAIDYLLKPVEPSDLENAIERFKAQREARTRQNLSGLNQLNASIPDKIGVPTSNGFRFIEKNDIVFLKADNSYTELKLNNGEQLLLCRILKNFEEIFAGDSNFIRCHKSYIINTKHISEFSRSNGGFLVMSDRTEIPVVQEKLSSVLDKNIIVKRG